MVDAFLRVKRRRASAMACPSPNCRCHHRALRRLRIHGLPPPWSVGAICALSSRSGLSERQGRTALFWLEYVAAYGLSQDEPGFALGYYAGTDYFPITVARARCHQPLRRGRGTSGAAGADAGAASAAARACAGAEGSAIGSGLVALGSRASASISWAAATGAGAAIVSS